MKHQEDINIYRNIRLENFVSGNSSFLHDHFIDVNGKNGKFSCKDFSFCVFTRGYFHNAKFDKCKFVGTFFYDCNFRNATFVDCDFSYSRFTGTIIPVKEVLSNLPAWANAKRELMRMHRTNAASIGDKYSEKSYIIEELNATKEHLRKAIEAKESYYSRKYNTLLKRFRARIELYSLNFDNWIWGHGENPARPIIAIFLFILASAIWTVIINSTNTTTIEQSLNFFIEAMLHYLKFFLGIDSTRTFQTSTIIDMSAAIFRILGIGILLAIVYRKISHR